MSLKHLAFLFFLSLIAAGCAANLSVDNKVIAVVGGRPITYGQFEQQYLQNSVPNSDSINSISSKKNFLNLLIDYRLKLMDARKEHLLDQPAMKSEMQKYETQLAVSYVLEHQITDPMVKKIYERRKSEVSAKEVFIQIKPDSAYPLGDTLKAYDEAMGVIKALKAGAPIDSLIHAYRGGDTYYVTAGTFLQYKGGEQFENMLYSLKPGEVGSYPVRTPYGYLVIKLEDRRPRVEAIRVSHILIKIDGTTPADTLKAYDKALAIMDSAKSGVDFAKLAHEYSADSLSAKRGGDLGYFKRGMMVRPFDEAAFDMTKIGQITGPVRTQFGYHIIKLTGIQPVPPFNEVKESLRSAYLNGGYKFDYDSFVEGLKKKYDFTLDEKAIDSLYAKVDSLKTFESADFDSLLTPEEMKMDLFTFDHEGGTVDTVLAIGREGGQSASLMLTRQNIVNIANAAGKDLVLAHYAVPAARTYPQFDSLITKYEDGIMIYQIEQEKVWDKIATTDSVLKPYFLAHTDRYTWPRRVDLSRIDVATQKLADSLHTQLKGGANFDTLAAKFDLGKEQRDSDGHWGLFADSANALVIEAFGMQPGQFSKPENFEGTFTIFKVNKFVSPEPKTFKEARGEVSADYQEYESNRLRKEWMQHLRNEFGVKVNEKTFDELISEK